MVDAASILFPNDAPSKPAEVPGWVTAQRDAAEQRLTGKHGQLDAKAAVVFPSETKSADASVVEGDPAATLFKTDATRKDVDYESIVGGEINAATLDAIQNGGTERADELRAATAALAKDFQAAGTDRTAIEEAFQIVRQSVGFAPPTPEESEASFAAGMSEIQAAGVTDADLSAARRFIGDLETVSPGVVASLEAHGAGNNPKLILAAVREARRRKY